MSVVARIAQRCEREYGIRVVWVDGCATRGNGQSWPDAGPGGLLNHHTAGGNNVVVDRNLIVGRPDLPGPLCNFALLYDGDLAVVAEHPANHAGASGGWDTAPFPKTSVFNRLILGVEIQYRGTEPMSPEQWHTALVLNKVTLEELGKAGQTQWLKFHQGTSVTGKWDIGYGNGKTYDVNHFRGEVLKLGAPAPQPPPQEDDDMAGSYPYPLPAATTKSGTDPAGKGHLEVIPIPPNTGLGAAKDGTVWLQLYAGWSSVKLHQLSSRGKGSAWVDLDRNKEGLEVIDGVLTLKGGHAVSWELPDGCIAVEARYETPEAFSALVEWRKL